MSSPIPTPNAMPGAQAPAADPAPPAEGQQPPAAPVDPAAPPAPAPPWGDDANFDPQRAWNLIQNVRNEFAEYKKTAQPALDAAEEQRRAEQGELDTVREDLAAAASRETAWRTEAIRSKAEALAAGKFVDAEVALALIGDVSGYTTADGKVDVAQLQSRLDQLAADKPFLVAQPAPQGFTPNRGQGQSGTGPLPLDAQIKAAQERGDVMGSIALKQQKFYQK